MTHFKQTAAFADIDRRFPRGDSGHHTRRSIQTKRSMPSCRDILNHLLSGVRLDALQDGRRKCEIEHFFDRPDVVNLDILQQFRLDVFPDVLLVLQRKNQFSNSGAPGRQDLFLDAADRQARDRSSVISPVMARRGLTGVLVSAETSAVTMVTPADGPSFGNGTGGHMNVDIGVLVEVGIQPKFERLGTHPGQRGLCRFLHDVADLTGDREMASTLRRYWLRRNRMSPPTGVQASPITTPGRLTRSSTSSSSRYFGRPEEFHDDIACHVSWSPLPSSIRRACLRQMPEISRSRLRTPVSRV